MKSQKEIFLTAEGDGWFARNRLDDGRLKTDPATDPVLNTIGKLSLAPRNILEIGASNGWRLSALKQKINDISCTGIEPSAKAVAAAASGVDMRQGTAEKLPFPNQSFDMIIFGFCLYLCDRNDLFTIAAEADRALAQKGHVIIYDFYPDTPYRNIYAHVTDVYSYKMDHARMFSWNPSYRIVHQAVMTHPGSAEDTPDNRTGITVLQKDTIAGWPDNPY